MFCAYCGVENADSSKFCKSCGKPLKPEVTTNTAEASPEKSDSPFVPLNENAADVVNQIDLKNNKASSAEEESPFTSISNLANDMLSELDSIEKPGAETIQESVESTENPFQSVEPKTEKPVTEKQPAQEVVQEARLAEMCPTFAKDLPNWDLVPPNILVIRK